jgi:trehalose/maltose hydrolase-like predicted phosphorylase
MEHTLAPTADPAWIIAENGFDPLRETSRQSRFAISNGFRGVRGGRAVNQDGQWVAEARILVAGLFDKPGPEQPVPALAATPDWLHLHILLSGKPLAHHHGDGSSHRRTLDMRRGLVLTECRVAHPHAPRIRLRSLHLVSLAQRPIGLQVVQLEIEDADIDVTVEASFAGRNSRLLIDRAEQDCIVWRTVSSGKRLGVAAGLSLQVDGRDLPQTASAPLQWSWRWTSRPGQLACLDRLVAVTRGDAWDSDPGPVAHEHLNVARGLGWRGVVAAHEAAWAVRWQSSDVVVEGDPAAQRSLRFALYHLNGAANPGDDRVSIAARALTGDDYRGHVFWDTEIFLLPFYALTWPEAARSLLMYRFHTLNGARAKAAAGGWRGAQYAWESADTGTETTPPMVIDPDRRVVKVKSGDQEQHISADIAYAVWRYWQVTGDDAFLLEAGAEMMLETGRFWSSRAQPEVDSLCHIRGVMGPDEYHESIDDNAFTNVMARWSIRRALDVAVLLRDRWPEHWASLSARLGLADAELRHWRGVAETMATGFDSKTGLFEQFGGYFGLEDIDLASYAGRSVPMDVVLGRERTQRSQVIKQADVIALLALLPEEFPGETAAANFHHYAPRCGHGSSLSRAMHGIAAARLGDAVGALGYFRQTSAIDLADTHAAIDGGVHIAALGGLWQMTVFGFAGLSFRDDGLAVDPILPDAWRSLGFSVQWRGRHLRIRIERVSQTVEATLDAGPAMTLAVAGHAFDLRPAETIRVPAGSSPRRL